MKMYNINDRPRALIFDMDNTLYTNREYTIHQEDVLIEKLSQKKSWSLQHARNQCESYRFEFSSANGGKKPSLAHMFQFFGISIAESVEWRNNLIRPDLFLAPDAALKKTLLILQKKYAMGLVTNNPTLIARQTLELLGVNTLFKVIVGLDSTYHSKPHPAAFRLVMTHLAASATECVSIGDRFEIDIEPALLLGMGGLLVEGVYEVYELPELLEQFEQQNHLDLGMS